MRKEILKSKMCLIALASILFVSCGGGGGGSSNLPLRPTPTPSVPKPSTPSTPSNPEDSYPKMTNPLDGQKGNMSALKTSLYNAQVASNVTIPKDTREEDGKVAGVNVGLLEGEGVKVAILDSDFQNAVRSSAKNEDGTAATVRRTRALNVIFPGTEVDIIPRITSEVRAKDGTLIATTPTTSQHGEEVLEVLRDMDSSGGPYYNRIHTILGSFGLDFYDPDESKNLFGAVLANKETYDAALTRFGNQSVKIFNQSFGGNKAYDDSSLAQYRNEGDSLPLYFNKVVGSTAPQVKQVPYFRDIVENKGGLFVWAAGNDAGKNSSLNAGLPYFEHRLEPGWISTVGVLDEDNGKYYVLGRGNYELSKAGFEAKWWSISALMYSAKNSQETDPNKKVGIGSSYAAPRVTMAAALVYEKYPWMTNDQIRQTLFTTTDKTELTEDPDTLSEAKLRNVTAFPNYTYGWGMLNTERALKGPGAFTDISKYGDTTIFKANIPAGTESYFDNDIYGEGGLETVGSGTLHLTGKNSFAGGSTVTSGTLEIHQVHASPVTVKAGAKLVLNPKAIVGYDVGRFELIENIDPQKITDSGIKVKNYGTVAFKGSTAIIGGDYVGYSGSTTELNFLSNVKVLGDIKYEPNTTVKILSNGYITKQSSSNTVMEGKSIEGKIANVEAQGMRNANVEIQNGKVVATLSRQNPVEYIGENAETSSKNVAENVEKVFKDLDQKVLSGTATKEELAMGATLQKMSTMGFTSATEMMSGEIYASAQALTFSQAQNVNRDLSNRLAGLDNFKNSNKDSEVWFSVLGSGGKLRRDGYASADTRVTGGQFGIDTKFNPTTTLGVAMNYSYAKANFNRYAGESKSNMVGVSFYAKQDLPYGFYTAGRLGLSNISSKVERELLTSTGDTVTGKINHHDKMLSAYVEIGKKIGWFTPFIGYSQDYLRRGSFNESEASWGVKAGSKNYRATNFLVGARAEYVGDKYKLQAYVTQAINTDKRDLSYEGRFTGSSVKQKFYGVKQAKNTTWIGFGAFREISPVFGVYGNVDFRVEDKKWADSVISTGLQYRF